MTTHAAALVWFRRDLRLTDNPALQHALEHARQIVPVYIHAPEEEAPWQPGAASRWWLHHSLAALDQSLRKHSSRLVLCRDASAAALLALAKQTGATLVCCNSLYEPATLKRDALVRQALDASGIELATFHGNVLVPPERVRTASDTPYRVFTPFLRALQKQAASMGNPWKAPRKLPAPGKWPDAVELEQLELLPDIAWDTGIAAAWKPGEDAALQRVHQFERRGIHDYIEGRDQPGIDGTSRLSPHLHFGEIGPRQVHVALSNGSAQSEAQRKKFLSELGWREFAHHLLYHYPHTPEQPLDARFARIRWSRDKRRLEAWQRGRTGIPIVDAGMRQLWHTGWMHNRVRMIVASLLTKNLHIDWHVGARWFWDTLVDADLANNTLGWQWVAGCGADAAPYFRIFNPVLQSQRFDADGDYIRRHVPELARLPTRWLHEPWAASPGVLQQAGLVLGRDYPLPIVDLKLSRDEALRSYRAALEPTRQRKG
ncbi:MAG: deoxyribodipyrimidine photo-lyase [Steroidobacteraceae bacterium]